MKGESIFETGGPKHLVRYGTAAEQKHLLGDFLETYDILVVNANMVAHTPAALAAFIGERAHNKPFLIDPQTHAFQHDISRLQTVDKEGRLRLRKSVESLAEAYGNPIDLKVTGDDPRVVTPNDFRDDKLRQDFASRVANFQVGHLHAYAVEQGLTRYYEYAGVEQSVTPVGITAPYFFMEADTVDDWIAINTRFVELTDQLFGREHHTLAQVVIDKDVLDSDELVRKVTDRYTSTPASAILLWIDDFSEHDASAQVLRRYLRFVKRLGETHCVVLLYGSFFSILISRVFPELGLNGVCHGLEYGEHRAVVPAVGGIPVSRFYHPQVHKRLRFPDAFKLVRPHLKSRDAYFGNVCSCGACREVIGSQDGDPMQLFGLYGKAHPVTFKRQHQVVTISYPDGDTRDRCVRHFMWCKQREFREQVDGEVTLERLEDAYQQYKDVVGPSEVSHCKTWARVIREEAAHA